MPNEPDTELAIYQESDLVLNLTGVPHFQFEKLPTYLKLKSFSLKEVDFAFYWKGRFYFLELKSFRKSASKEFKNKLLNDLPAKAIHSFLMMGTVWSNTPLGQHFITEGIPAECANVQSVEIIFALKLPAGFESYLGPLNTQINASLKDCLHFPDPQAPVLVDYSMLCRRFPFIRQLSTD